MTEDALTPAEEERVRRLLAEARHTDPMPADLADRFDAVIGELAAERDDEASSDEPAAAAAAAVVSLDAARRRRRRLSGLLVAAAAVVAVGVGVPSYFHAMTSASNDSMAGGAPAADAAGGDQPETTGGGRGSSTESGKDSTAPTPEGAQQYAAEAPRVAASHFRRDAIRLASADNAALTSGSAGDDARTKSLFDLAGCTRSPEWGKGRGVAVVFDDIPALMIYRTPVGGLQQVDLYVCASTDAELTTQIPAS